jgi:CDP-glycerol glycerophosphotransferase (TagB/SpsB family)
MGHVTELALPEAVPLAHAVVDRVARDHAVRILFIKGPTAVAQGLRSPRVSLDVDALVDPARRGALADALAELGWIDEHPYTSPTVLPMHSLTHRHPSWPCELDLHDRFPGFFADPRDVFDRLWERRTTVEVADREIACVDRAAQALVLALHALRDPHEPAKAADLSELLDRVTDLFDDSDLRDLAELAHALGAADTAAPFLIAAGAPEVGRGTTDADDLRAWRLRTQPSQTTAVSWVETWRTLPKRSWPRYLWYAATLSDAELRLANPGLAPGRAALLRARMRRLRRGLGALPHAVRDVRALQRAEPDWSGPPDRSPGTSRPGAWPLVRLGSAGLGLADRALPFKRGVVIRTFPDFDDQGLETVRALADSGIGPLTWLSKAGDPAPGVRHRLPKDVRVCDSGSWAGVLAYLRARVVVHTHGLYGVPARSRRKTFVNLWHGMPVKRLDPRPPVALRQTDVLTVTSPLHGANLRRTWGLDRSVVAVTGLPRNDAMLRASGRPRPEVLRAWAGDGPLVVWLPTYRHSILGEVREDGHDFGNDFQLPRATRAGVDAIAERLGVRLVVKTHPMAPLHSSGNRWSLDVWDDHDLAAHGLTLYELLGHADALVTDYSSVWVDYLLLDRPMVFTLADLDEYAGSRRLYFEPLADHLPGPVAGDLDRLATHLAEALATDPWATRRRQLCAEHHTHADAGSAERVAALVADRLGRRGRGPS